MVVMAFKIAGSRTARQSHIMLFEIRPYQSADENSVLALWASCGLFTIDSNPQADIHRKLAVQPELFVVGTLASAVIASGMAGDDGHRGYLYYLAVRPDHQRKGYGRAMVTHIQQLLYKRGCKKLNLFVSPENLSALNFYKHLGFSYNDMFSMGRFH